MIDWIIALVIASILALLQYGRPGRIPGSLWPMALRWVSVALIAALLLGAPSGPPRQPPAMVALDASASWLRGGDSSTWKQALQEATSRSSEQPLLFGDSARALEEGAVPADRNSVVRPAVDRALAAGRPLVVLTDGVIDDPDALTGLPAGSRVDVRPPPEFPDLAAVSLDAPRSLVSGDTIDIAITVASGALRTAGSRVVLQAGGRVLDTIRVDPMTPFSERRLSVRVTPPGSGPVLVTAIAQLDGDREPRNDTIAAALEITRGAAAVFVSSSPDEDSRFALSVLRGTLALPTRAYLQLAPGVWKVEGTLTPITGDQVRSALQSAPLAVLHGDTGVFGPPRALGRGALALLPNNIERGADWFAVGAPASPLMNALSDLPWDSLPPLDVSSRMPTGDWAALTVARSRQLDRQPAIVGYEGARRIIIVGAAGFWRWRFRGGASEPAYTALWGSVFDWLAAGRFDARAALPAQASVRAGEGVAWHRGTSIDSSVNVALIRRGITPDTVTLALHFGQGASAATPPLSPGVYDARVRGGSAVIVVNASGELLPRQPTVRAGPVGARMASTEAPRLRDRMWPYVVVVLALCAEWILRRRAGLR